MPTPFYVTTPIYYVNDRPHIGHAYTSIAADVLARYHRLRGEPARMLTGTDEHGLKLERRARELGQDPQAFVDSMAPRFVETAKAMGCAPDDFIRTTEARHKHGVQELWRRMEEKGDIFLDEYRGLYCVGCEAYYTEKDLTDGKVCPVHKRPVEEVTEKSFFFRLSRFTEPLLAHFDAHPTFVAPEGRFNEVKSFVREGLRDLSISRTSFKWGVPVPGHPDHVMYVWLDALTNYISALGGPDPSAAAFQAFWPPKARAVHLVGKDILRFHAVYWPAFLLSAGVPLPTQVWAHGWLTVNGEKMSKSLGNFIPPEPIAKEFGADVLRYYLMRDVGFGQDGDFSHRNLLARYHGDLGNGLGNLLNRIVSSIVVKNLDGKVPTPGDLTTLDTELAGLAERSAKAAAEHLESVQPHRALDAIWELVAAANKYVDQTAPWALAKQGDTARLGTVTYTVLEALRWLSVLLAPFMPEKTRALRAQLGLPPLEPAEGKDRWPTAHAWGALEPGTAVRPSAPLFPRFDEAEEKAVLDRLMPKVPTMMNPESPAAPPSTAASSATAPAAAVPGHTVSGSPANAEGFIEFEDFAKVKLKLGLVTAAERVPKSDKMLKLLIDVGEAAPRQVLAGIGKHYEPEALIGKRLVVVVNLKPRKMMGLESQGMVLAASDDQALSFLGVDKEIRPGGEVK